MVLKEGNIVKVEYTGMDEKGEIFDTTVEKKAIEAGIYNEKRKYKPIVAVIGEKNFFDKVDEEIKKSEKGKKFTVELEPREAFGERNAEFIRMVPMRDFKARKLSPFPGMPVEINNMQGRVQTVSGGRVRVDFNHPLAGKKLKYEIEIKETITDREEKIKALLEKYFPFVEPQKITYNLKGDELEITLPEQAQNSKPIRKAFAESALKNASVKKVRFIEEYSKQEKTTPKETKQKETKTTEKTMANKTAEKTKQEKKETNKTPRAEQEKTKTPEEKG